MSLRPRAAVILAAGQGTRMKSPLPKVLHPVGGRPMLDRAIDAAEALGCQRIIVVVGAHSPEVGRHVRARRGEGSTVLQDPPLGTGHAVRMAEPVLGDFDGDVVITYADCPLLEAGAIDALFQTGADLSVLGFEAADPGAYGRLILNDEGGLDRIVEAKDATEAERAVTLCNSGVMALDRALLFSLLAQVTNDNAKGEFYLTDIVGLAGQRGLRSAVAVVPETAVQGVNSQAELAEAEAVWQRGRRAALMAEGVRMVAPETVFLCWDTAIGAGAVIEPNVVFGPGVSVAPGAVIRAFSHLEGARVDAGAIVGPYARLRPGAEIGEGAHIGNFVEVKNVTVGPGAKANHLAYLGDGQVGARANVGAGTIFCNYDGFNKHHTTVGEGAFIGSNTALVAPVSVGRDAMTGSGSVITADVPDGALALGRARQEVKPGWAARFKALMAERKAKA